MTFFKSMLANVLSIFLVLLLLVGIIAAIIVKIAHHDEVKIQENSILHIVLDGELNDQALSNEFSFDNQPALSLTELEIAIAQAAKDSKIKAIYLELKNLHAGVANCERLRQIIIDFKKSKKPVICYAENFSLLAYYAVSVSDEIVLHPMGYLEWKGLSAQLMYFKSMLSSIGIQAEPIKVGKYKSAIEPFISDTISSENEFQIKALLGDIWSKVKRDVAISRQIDENQLDEIADSLGVLIASEAKAQKLITQIAHKDYIESYFKGKFGKIEFADFVDYHASLLTSKSNSTAKIALVYADGLISSNEDSEDISPEKYQTIFKEIAADSDIKGMVIRINSPGGSASVSETIWQQVQLLRKKMPVYISMGNVAASGGYYIASAGDSIFAEKTTITGSIGVYGLMFNVEALKNKIGVSVEKVNTNYLSDFPSIDRPLSKVEKRRLQMGVDSIYNLFLKRVATSRRMDVSAVHELAQGRVWTGKQALQNGLVDGNKSLQQVVASMGKKLDIASFEITEYPIPQNALQKIMSKFDNKVELKLPESFSYLNEITRYLEICQNFTKPQCQMPFVLEIQ